MRLGRKSIGFAHIQQAVGGVDGDGVGAAAGGDYGSVAGASEGIWVAGVEVHQFRAADAQGDEDVAGVARTGVSGGDGEFGDCSGGKSHGLFLLAGGGQQAGAGADGDGTQLGYAGYAIDQPTVGRVHLQGAGRIGADGRVPICLSENTARSNRIKEDSAKRAHVEKIAVGREGHGQRFGRKSIGSDRGQRA